MLSKDISKLELENYNLKKALKELEEKMEKNSVIKPKSCQYCKYYLQHYIKGGYPYRTEYTPIYDGHCSKGVPIKKGGKRKAVPDDSCMYFELGTVDMKRV